MTYQETIEYLYNATPTFHLQGAAAYKEGLDNTLALDSRFGHPHRRYKTIHVAGTNGKGSCSSMIAAYLQTLGYRTGLYTSPHIHDFRERIRVNGEMIPEQRVIDFVEEHRPFFEPLRPSFFELTTALALKYFAEQEVDIAVIEVGLGGRLDCTNIIRPILSVITNIALDHTALLGDTLPKIAAEKAGIIKPNVPCVVGESLPETRPVFLEKAKEQAAPIVFAEEAISDEELDLYLPHLELKGNYQRKNLRTVLAAISVLGLTQGQPLQEETDASVGAGLVSARIKTALENVTSLTGLAGRWQTISDSPRTIIDTGHNVAGWQYLSQQLNQEQAALKPGARLRIIFGMVDDKDVDAVMRLLPRQAVYYFTQASTHRAIPVNIIAEKAAALNLQGQSFPTANEAYQAALKDSQEAARQALKDSQSAARQAVSNNDIIFIGGSNYILGDLEF